MKTPRILPHRRRFLGNAGAGIVGVLLVGARAPEGMPGDARQVGRTGTASAKTGRSGRQVFTVRAEGFDWRCTVQAPGRVLAGQAIPVVLVLHGSGGQGGTMLEKSNWARKAEDADFLAVAPDALPINPLGVPSFWLNPRVWSSGQLDPKSTRAKVDDIRFFRVLLDELGRRFPIDRRRIYVTGHSNGAAMAFRLATGLSERIAAIAPVGSVCWIDDPRPRRAVPTLFIVGASDPLVPIRGGETVLPWGKRTSPPVAETLQKWAQAMGSPTRPRLTEKRANLEVTIYGPGRDGVSLTALVVDGQGHNWPGGKEIVPVMLGPETKKFDATEVIWSFFREHQIRTPPLDPTTSDGRRLEEPVMFVR